MAIKTKKISNHTVSLTEGDFSRIANLIHNTFDTRTATLATKKDLDGLKNDVKNIKATMATKQDLQELKAELKQYTHEGVETIMAELDRIEEKLAEKEEVGKLKIWAAKVGQKIGVAL